MRVGVVVGYLGFSGSRIYWTMGVSGEGESFINVRRTMDSVGPGVLENAIDGLLTLSISIPFRRHSWERLRQYHLYCLPPL